MEATKTRMGLRADTLYWDKAGQVNCGEHAPYYRSDTWLSGAWVAIRSKDADENQLSCEVCNTKNRRGGK